ncbi:tetratricopeptide [Rhodovulum sp. P5]|nr:tetratricopeptide [Rhodovulum sp. P5]
MWHRILYVLTVPVRRIGDILIFLRTLVVNLTVISVVVALVALTGIELRRNPVIIEEIGLPPQLTARGLSGTVAAHRLWDAITDIQTISGTFKDQASLTTIGRQIDVVDPDTGLSLQGLTQMLRTLLGLPQTRIAGEVVCETARCDWAGLRLRLRIFAPEGMEVRNVGLVGGHSPGDYFHRAAMETMKVIDPYTLAVFHKNKDTSDRSAASRLARDLIARGHPQRAWAANLLGILSADSGDRDAAIQWYQKSIAFSDADGLDDFALPWSNWGNVLGDLEHEYDAIGKFRQAIEIDPLYAPAWAGMGHALAILERYEEAVESLERATAIDPQFALAWYRWGKALSDLERPAEATEKFRRATEIDPDYALAWYHSGSALEKIGRHPEARASFRRAMEIDPEIASANRKRMPSEGFGGNFGGVFR